MVCTTCGTILTENVTCTGGSATCTEAAKCTACGGAYGALADHVGVWVGDVYKCNNCGEVFGDVDTELDKQTVASFTNAESIAATTINYSKQSITNNVLKNTKTEKRIPMGVFAV